jgi:hypothetical protein
MNVQLDAHTVTIEIERLLAEYPELADDGDLRRDMIEGETEAMAILTELASRIADASSMQVAVKDRLDALRSRKERFAKHEELWRRLALRIMQAANIKKAQLGEATLSVRSTPPAPIVTDEEALPEWAWRIKRELDKTAIRDHLKAGEFVPGAEMSNGDETLSVRT